MQSSLVSVLMPAYNAEKYILEAVQSVLAQTYPHWELIVVNDGSTDQTRGLLNQITDPRVRVIDQANGGEASARNTALRNAQGDYIAFLDADDLFLPNHLEAAVRYLEKKPEYDGVLCDGYHIDQAGNRSLKLSERRMGPFEGKVFEHSVRSQNVLGPPISLVLRRKPIVERNISFDAGIAYGTDWDFFTHFSEHSMMGYLAEATCLYRVHPANMSLQMNAEKRRKAWVTCRRKAIQLDSFHSCSAEIRWFVFYDLLVNLLNGHPDEQAEILQWHEFCELMPGDRAQLLRLMASKAILGKAKHAEIKKWLLRSRELNPADNRTRLVAGFYQFNPWICRLLLAARETIGRQVNRSDFILDGIR